MDFSVIIVSWKVKNLLRQCLRSIFDMSSGIDFEVIVVDNASADGTAEMVINEFPQVSLIASNVNLGFAAGNNLALEHAGGDIVYLLNPDTELKSNTLADLKRFMDSRPSAGVVGTKLLNPDGTNQRSVRRFPTIAQSALWILKIHRLLPNLGLFKRYLADDFNYGISQQCQQVMGASMAIRRSVLDRIGCLDERYFIWFEEVDYCRMASDAGFQVWYTPDAVVTHFGGESFGQVNGLLNQRRFNASLRQYMLKHHGPAAWLVLWLLQPASLLLAWLAEILKRKDR